MKKVITPMTVVAADSNSRTITGTIVTFEETGNASIGKVQFAANSIEPTPVLLNLEHDRSRRIGKTLSIESTDKEMVATFRIAETTAGNDALVEAAEGLRDGFSVEVSFDEYEVLKDGTVRILKGELTGVALTSEPAIRSARVSEVAATEEEEKVSDSTTETEETTTTEGDEVENTVNDASAVETVEAAQSTTAASKPIVGGSFTKPRIELTAAKYLENKIQAALGDENARQYVLAADNSTDNAGFVPTPQMTSVINGLSTMVRPSIDAISRGTLPAAGLTFEIPKVTTAPTAAAADEDAAFSETDQAASHLSVTVKKFASQQKFSVELLQRTSPNFYDELLRNMYAAMAKAQDAYVNAAIIAGATADATTVSTYPTAAELLGFVARGAASVYGATAGLANPFAKNLIANTSQWSNIMSLNDSGRPIYVASQPSNAGGVARPDSLRGNVAGLDLYVTANTAAGTDTDGSLIVVNPDAYTWYEDPAQYMLRAESTADGSVTVGLYSFGACATKIGAGAFKINKA
jgi:HK97 family phage major capsid protein